MENVASFILSYFLLNELFEKIPAKLQKKGGGVAKEGEQNNLPPPPPFFSFFYQQFRDELDLRHMIKENLISD